MPCGWNHPVPVVLPITTHRQIFAFWYILSPTSHLPAADVRLRVQGCLRLDLSGNHLWLESIIPVGQKQD